MSVCKSHVVGFISAALLSLLSGTALAAEPATTDFSRFAISAPPTIAGQSRTLLPDGRWLLIGGSTNETKAAVFAQVAEKSTRLSARLIQPRSWHTATVLPDGSVLILGGVDASGATVLAAEILDPVTGEITVIQDSGLTPRSRHTATLLTEGYVLVSGGLSATGQALQDAELWNPETQRVEPLSNSMLVPRAHHSAALLADGKGLLWGGQDGSGRPLTNGEVYDPSSTIFTAVGAQDALLPASPVRDTPPGIEASIPQANATDAPVDGRIAIRFNKYLQVSSVTAQSVTLVGPAGAVPGKVVAAGEGLLTFFTPRADLLPNATYTVFLRGVLDANGNPLPWSAFKFTTRSLISTKIARDGGSVTFDNQSSADSNTVAAAGASANRSSGDKSRDARKRSDEQEREKASADDDFEDWIPGEHHRHGQWRVLGTRNEPRTSKALTRFAPLQAATKRATGVSGRVARLNGLPIQGVTVRAGNVSTVTDAQGRFVLAGLRAGAQEINVDGSAVTSEGRRYASHFIRVEVAGRSTTELDQPIYLARLNPANDISIPSPADRDLVLTHPDIPGLELHIRKGTVLRSREGRIITKLNITPLPVDRVPFAVPNGFPVYFTIQPAGGFVDGSATGTAAGVRVIYPNYLDAPAGARMTFWNYDPRGLGWQVYGRGTVSQDGRQVVPDADVSQRDFMAFGYGFDNQGQDAKESPTCETDAEAADPVDRSTGLFIHRRTDLYVTDTLPLSVSRMYRTNDGISRDFGIGANHNYGWFLSNPTGEAVPPMVDLILADGRRVRFKLLSGTTIGNAVYRHVSSPSSWLGATLRINASADQWEITTSDKTVYSFSPHLPNVLRSIRDRYGNTVTIKRVGEGGNIEYVRSPNGRTLTFTYDGGNRIIRIRDNLGRTVRYEYDSQGRLWKAYDADNKMEQYGYDTLHRMTSVIDRRGNTMAVNEYDANSRVAKQTLADGAFYNFAYTLSDAGKVIQTIVTNPRGFIKVMSFNGQGYLTQVIHALGQPEQQIYTYERDEMSNLRVTVTDPLGRVTMQTFDHFGNRTTLTRLFGTPDAVQDSYSYEPRFGNLASYTDPLGHTTHLTYDDSGNPTSATDPLSHSVTAGYDDYGRLLSVTDALGKTAFIAYDQADVSSIRDPLDRVTWLFSDAGGRTIGVLDAAGNRSRYEYDSLDRLLRSIDPDGAVTAITYDENDNVRTVRDPRDLASHVFTYDSRNRTDTYTDPLGKTESYAYDGMGNVTSMTDRKGQVTSYTYDALDRMKTVTHHDGTTVTFVWDAANRVRQVIDSANGTITLDYDDLDRLTREISPQGQVDYEYDDAGRRTRLIVAGREPIIYGYDDADRLSRIEQGSVAIDFTYDASDRRATVTWPNGIVGTYVFDDADQLLSIAYDLRSTRVGEITYTYDLAGRRTGQSGSLSKLTLPASISTAIYDAANRLTHWGGESLSYDDNGNLVSHGAATYGWNVRDQLISTSVGAGSFAYDGFGRRASRTVAGATVSYLHDGVNPVLVNNELMLSGFGIDELYARVSSVGVTSHLPDALGSTRLLTDSAGDASASYAYTPYGEASRTGSDSTLFQFTGRENDGATGLNYHRARYYNASIGRFIQGDPIGLEGGLNTYAYALQNPVQLSDPLGFASLDPTREVKEILRRNRRGSALESCNVKILGSIMNADAEGLATALLECNDIPLDDIQKLKQLCEIQKTPIQKLLEGTGKLKDLRQNPNLKGVDIDAIIRGTPQDLRKLGLSEKQLSPIKKALQESRDLSGRKGGGR